MFRLLPLAALVALAACADSEPPDAAPEEEGGAYNVIGPVRAEVAPDEAPAIGEWARTLQEEEPALVFGPTGAEPLASIRCEGDGIILNRHGLVDTEGAQMMTLTLGEASSRLAVSPVQAPLPMLRAVVQSGDPLLERIAAHTGTVQLAFGDGPPLTLPPSPLIGEFVKACASGEAAPREAPAGNAAEANQASAGE